MYALVCKIKAFPDKPPVKTVHLSDLVITEKKFKNFIISYLLNIFNHEILISFSTENAENGSIYLRLEDMVIFRIKYIGNTDKYNLIKIGRCDIIQTS